MNATKKTIAIAVLAATGLLSACSTGNPDATSVAADKPIVDKDNWPKPVPDQGIVKGLALPLETYMVSYADTVVIDEAKNALQKQCMTDYGLTIDFPKPGANPPPSNNDANMERRYGITDRIMAEKYGYGLPDALMRHTDQPMGDLSDVQVEVLTGYTKPEPPKAPKGAEDGAYFTPPGKTAPARAEHNGKKLREGGCAGWSEKQLGSITQEPDMFTVSKLNGESLIQSQQAAPVQAAIKDWSSCMKGKGHDAADPYKAMNQGTSQDGKATKETIALALDDIDCKTEADLVKIWFDEESKIQNQQIKDNKAALDPVKDRHGKLMSAASSASKN